MGTKYVYEVTLDGGRNNSSYFPWLENVMNLNAKQPDFGGIQNLCILSHSQDASTVHMLCTQNFKKAEDELDVQVTEITKATLASANSTHRMHTQLIKKCFLPYDSYPHILP